MATLEGKEELDLQPELIDIVVIMSLGCVRHPEFLTFALLITPQGASQDVVLTAGFQGRVQEWAEL